MTRDLTAEGPVPGQERIDVGMGGPVKLMQGDARHLDLPDNSVDLIVTSPPYFGLRSYQDGGEHYQGQIGDEATPAEFVDALIECTKEMMRVTKPTGSIWVNLGDKYATAGTRRGNEEGLVDSDHRTATHYMPRPAGFPNKSLMGIPWRYAIRCIDELGLILRAEVIWAKPNGLPESVKDRVRRSHEQWFHFTLSPRYYANLDAVRETYTGERALSRRVKHTGAGAEGNKQSSKPWTAENPLGSIPRSVRTVATEPLRVPDELGVDHYAAFPTAWPRWIIQGWSPEPGECTACGGGDSGNGQCMDCALCIEPAVVLDPFGGTGTTALVASALGRTGISNDMSADYTRIAAWRTTDPKQRAKAAGVAYKAPPKMRAENPLFPMANPRREETERGEDARHQAGLLDR